MDRYGAGPFQMAKNKWALKLGAPSIEKNNHLPQPSIFLFHVYFPGFFFGGIFNGAKWSYQQTKEAFWSKYSKHNPWKIQYPKHPLFQNSSIVGIIAHPFLVADQFGYVPRGTLKKSWRNRTTPDAEGASYFKNILTDFEDKNIRSLLGYHNQGVFLQQQT